MELVVVERGQQQMSSEMLDKLTDSICACNISGPLAPSEYSMGIYRC